jgi:hypothetical protein
LGLSKNQQKLYLVDFFKKSVVGGSNKYFKMNYAIDGMRLCATAAAKAYGVTRKIFETISSKVKSDNTARLLIHKVNTHY